ncbi:unnamed protein product [Paramecium octaurelia]|uniref:Transmembrane protein n=1 Tax=Paramecium octaurelia TaxID=43137 RepID=A0A8S1USH6_PAROT|nr:unnamed protein product [Paramecium octaurelia]
MLILIFLNFIIGILCVNRNESKVILTDFYNKNSPVFVIAPYYESYTIDLFNSKDVLENTSFNDVNSTNKNLSFQITPFIETSSESIEQAFCPVDEWGPLYQPARFYLSQTAIDLLFYNQTNDKIVQVQNKLHRDLPDLNENFQNISCYSIFQLRKNNQFGLDCNINNNASILIFDLVFDEKTQIIVNFTYNDYYYYSYDDEDNENFLKKCQFRKTINVNIMDVANEIKFEFLQYCPSLFNQKAITNDFLIIYHDRLTRHNRTLKLDAFKANITDLNSCKMDENSMIEQVFINSLINGFDNTTWNIGFLFQSSPTICKCNVQEAYTSHYNIKCNSTLIELYQPNQIRMVQNLNDEVVLVTGTNIAILVIYLERSYESENFFTISYKQIFEPGYLLVDMSITSQYLAVIMTDSPFAQQISPFYSKPNLYCTRQASGETKNILKIFYLNAEYKTVYYQSDTFNQFQSFFQSLNQIDFGNFILLYNFFNKKLNIITLFEKQLNVSYLLGQDNLAQTYNQQIAPVIISFNISGGYFVYDQFQDTYHYNVVTFPRYIILCFIKLEDSSFQLIAQIHKLEQKEQQNLTQCPISKDIYVFQEIINSIDLFEGIMGPFLNFNYVPNYNISRFYPYYQNHKAVIKQNQFFEKHNQTRSVFNVLSAVNKNVFITSNIFGIVEILLTYSDIGKEPSPKKLDSVKAVIFNKTCIINAKEYQSFEKQFPMDIEIQQCTEGRYRDLQKYLDEVNYYKQFEYYDIAVQYQDSIIVICQKIETLGGRERCQNITDMERPGDIVKQLVILQGPIKNERVSYFFTILYNSTQTKLYFYVLDVFLPSQLNPGITYHNSSLYNLLDTQNLIVSFRYTYINQQTLFILFSSSQIVVYTPGPSNSTRDVKLYNFTSTLTNVVLNIPECQNNNYLGFEITKYFQSKLAKQYLIVYCQENANGNFTPYILQYIITNINQINFWRRLPHYDTILSNQTILISGLILYVPVITKSVYNDYFQNYYIYNLEDYTARSLVEKIEIEKKKNESIITYPISNLMDSLIAGSSISLTLIITEKKFEIYYLNQKAEFIFHLQSQFIPVYNNSPFVLVIGVFQPQKTKTMFRNYTLVYNFTSTQISFAYDSSETYKVVINQDQYVEAGGFYQYLFLVNQSIFNGPIASYDHSSNQQNLSIIPSPYLQMNKYLGSYMNEVSQFGEITQIIDVGDEIYIGLFNQTINNVNNYNELIIVLTDYYVLFYQKHSIPDANRSCIYFDYTQGQQTTNSSLCSIRLIHYHQFKPFNSFLYCQMQLNGVNVLIIVCQLKYFHKLSDNLSFQNKENIQQYIYLEYYYTKQNNNISIPTFVTNNRQFCFCYFNDLQPFLYNNQVYQMIKTGYQQLNSYFGIYQIVLKDNQTIQFIQYNSYPNQNDSQPFQYSEDFALSVIQWEQIQQLYLIVLQPNNIFVQVINLTDGFPAYGPGQNLIFQDDEDYVRFEKAVFIQAINRFQPHVVNESHMTQTLSVGNNNQIYEIAFDVQTFQAKLQYTFYQYLLCHHNFLSRPQIELSYQNDTVFYIVSQCLSNQFEYQSVQVEMTYLLNELNTNIVYTSLFIRNYSRNYSRPVEILEPYLVNPQELHFQKIQLYQSDAQANTSKSHLLITNSTYFLIDLILYAENGYYLYYPILSANDDRDHSVYLNITAYNSYSSCQAQFEIGWIEQDSEVNSLAWFYAILSLLLLLILVVIVVAVYGFCEKQSQIGKKDQNLPLERIGDDESEYGVELQGPGYNQLMLGDVFKDLLRNNKSKKQTVSYTDELSD